MSDINVILTENIQVNKHYNVKLTKEDIVEYLKIKGVDFGKQELKIFLRSTDNIEVFLENDNPLNITCYVYEQSTSEKTV